MAEYMSTTHTHSGLHPLLIHSFGVPYTPQDVQTLIDSMDPAYGFLTAVQKLGSLCGDLWHWFKNKIKNKGKHRSPPIIPHSSFLVSDIHYLDFFPILFYCPSSLSYTLSVG